ncbi:hypothetical protein LZ32DRAFT_177277 [Colletotrichum eremochloae]|nr:hypothetical protein LY78DRAFT_446520 [Colletotrichum sublineola]KAK2014822.1 hypothetical protein LZ32DRAFT_177277 [Colletotrichum eremochloae]
MWAGFPLLLLTTQHINGMAFPAALEDEDDTNFFSSEISLVEDFSSFSFGFRQVHYRVFRSPMMECVRERPLSVWFGKHIPHIAHTTLLTSTIHPYIFLQVEQIDAALKDMR